MAMAPNERARALSRIRDEVKEDVLIEDQGTILAVGRCIFVSL